MRVLITGGTGVIGSRLALRGSRGPRAGSWNNAAEAAHRGLCPRQRSCAMVGHRGGQPADIVAGMDVVFHLAAAQHEASVPDSHFESVNVAGTRNVLAASARAGVERFVHGSTIGVYRTSPTEVVGDDSPLEPDNIYGVTKLAAERVVAEFASRIPTVIVRISETYGPGDRRLLKLFKAASKGLLQVVAVNLHQPIYIDDLLDGLLVAAACSPPRGPRCARGARVRPVRSLRVARSAGGLGSCGSDGAADGRGSDLRGFSDRWIQLCTRPWTSSAVPFQGGGAQKIWA
jgi:nucleoside-diphosphate-sugar epimerase